MTRPRGVANAGLTLLEAVGSAYDKDSGMRVAMIPGQVVVDDWCWGGCGAAYVRLDSAYASTRFPAADAAPSCTSPLAARFHVGVHRCVSGMDDAGNPPPADAQTEDALLLMEDVTVLRCALRDVAAVSWGRNDFLLGAWTPVGPLGNCAGGFWAVTVRV